jgi:hypothetical protein
MGEFVYCQIIRIFPRVAQRDDSKAGHIMVTHDTCIHHSKKIQADCSESSKNPKSTNYRYSGQQKVRASELFQHVTPKM